MAHRRLDPVGRTRGEVADGGAELLVPVAEDGRRHLHAVARRALHGVAAAVDLRGDPLDLDAGRGLAGLGQCHEA